MAKNQPGQTMSDLIRGYFKAHRGMRNRDVIARIKEEHGIDVKPTLVTSVKFRLRPRKRGRRKQWAEANAATTHELSMDDLLFAKKVADRLGGIKKAKKVLRVLAQLA